ncbi:hypothetical protein [Pseudoponticoccus marisrubri]|uniref:Uncharacterized protein n=1 Tax=Pseudoponticoccus marisrubri TaxID=1685382 RepID=A0A0W7WDR7_9RHOB|nr:hypothetical protein [Pseudoponticoccus marisrubri]KUF08780.1 hypothetical protein AVJ23_20905 [Pseudoponticoccus marisrubri]
MAAPRPEPPRGLASPPLDPAQLGLWRPLASVLAGLILPALVAGALLVIAGEPGFAESGWLRGRLLLAVYALVAAPALGWLLLPLLWPLVLVMAQRGWAGLCAFLVVANVLGLIVAHVALNGDLTSEAPGTVPILVLALSLQAVTAWAVLWALVPAVRHAPAEGSAARVAR